MDRRLLPLLLVLAIPLVACDRAATPADASMPDDDAGGAVVDAPAVPGEGTSTLPAEFVVSTNEPFWQARVEGGEVVLNGPDVDNRRFTIDTDDAGDDARVVNASDGAGAISVTLLPGPCQDSMSGATFPLAGELTIDGIGPTPGCARPADMPPPGEPGH
ncbi:hypothetical protein [Luteimonas arsenica]|uniref:hypothetical protein n=1 Tax=Luteimonas arsenica TaxID=1586242 RepID=UPI001404E7CF|nr:hypothetical protein [Luteimonas arsenica]